MSVPTNPPTPCLGGGGSERTHIRGSTWGPDFFQCFTPRRNKTPLQGWRGSGHTLKIIKIILNVCVCGFIYPHGHLCACVCSCVACMSVCLYVCLCMCAYACISVCVGVWVCSLQRAPALMYKQTHPQFLIDVRI